MSTNQTIKVFVRTKPLPVNENISATERNVLNIDETNSLISFSRDRKGQADFQFSKVFGPTVTQQSVYSECSNVVIQDVMEGINCCIMAYGQTGSGKTYTMYGKGWDDPLTSTTVNNPTNGMLNGIAEAATPTQSSKKSIVGTDSECLPDGDTVGQINSNELTSYATDLNEPADSSRGSTANTITGETNTVPSLLPLSISSAISDDDSMLGVIPRSIADLFKVLDDKAAMSVVKKTHFDFSISCQVMQIYNEKIYDLLQDRRRENPLQLREASGSNNSGDSNTVCVRGMSVFRIYSKEEAFQLLRKGLRNRAIRATDFNSESSRSHTILQLFVTVEEDDTQGIRILKRSTFSLVDLAGSEKWRSSLAQSSDGTGTSSSVNVHNSAQQSADMQLKEMNNINTSLHVLGNCVSALIEVPTRKHIPYRDSILTRLLQDALGGNGRTILIATVHNDQVYREETYSTLQFASRASCIKVVLTNNISINTDRTSLEQAQKQIKALRAKVLELQQTAAGGASNIDTSATLQRQRSNPGLYNTTSNACISCEMNSKTLVGVKKQLQEQKEINAYLLETLDSHYIPYDLGSIVHSNKTGSKLNSPVVTRDGRSNSSGVLSNSINGSLFNLLADVPVSLTGSIAMQRYSPSPSRQQTQLIPPSSADYTSSGTNKDKDVLMDLTSLETYDVGMDEDDERSVVSLSASKAGSISSFSLKDLPTKPLSSSGMRKKVKKGTNGSSSKLQSKLKATVNTGAASPGINSAVTETPTKLVKPRRVVNAEGLVVDCYEPLVEGTVYPNSNIAIKSHYRDSIAADNEVVLHHSVSAPNAVIQKQPSPTKQKKSKISQQISDDVVNNITSNSPPPADSIVTLAKHKIKQGSSSSSSLSSSFKPKQSPFLPADNSFEAAIYAANSALGIKQPKINTSPTKSMRIEPSSSGNIIGSRNMETESVHVNPNIAPPDSLTPKLDVTFSPSVYVPTDYSSAVSVLSKSQELTRSLTKSVVPSVAVNSPAVESLNVSAKVNSSNTVSQAVTSSQNVHASSSSASERPISGTMRDRPFSAATAAALDAALICVKHSLASCVLCQMFNAPFTTSAVVPTEKSKPFSMPGTTAAPSTLSAAHGSSSSSPAISNSQYTIGHTPQNGSTERRVLQQSDHSRILGSSQHTPTARQNFIPQQFSSSMHASVPSVLDEGFGESCKTHGVTDCLLCAMRAKRESAAAASNVEASHQQHVSNVYGNYSPARRLNNTDAAETTSSFGRFGQQSSPHNSASFSPIVANNNPQSHSIRDNQSYMPAPYPASLDSNDSSQMGYGFVDYNTNNGVSSSKLRGISYATSGGGGEFLGSENWNSQNQSLLHNGGNKPLMSPYSYSNNTDKRYGVNRIQSSNVDNVNTVSSNQNHTNAASQQKSFLQQNHDANNIDRKISPRINEIRSIPQLGTQYQQDGDDDDDDDDDEAKVSQNGYKYSNDYQHKQSSQQQQQRSYDELSNQNTITTRKPRHLRELEYSKDSQRDANQFVGSHQQMQPQQQQHVYHLNTPSQSINNYTTNTTLQASHGSMHSHISSNSHGSGKRENHRYDQYQEAPSPHHTVSIPASDPTLHYPKIVPSPHVQSSMVLPHHVQHVSPAKYQHEDFVHKSPPKSKIRYEDETDYQRDEGEDESNEDEEEDERPSSRLGTSELDRRTNAQIDNMMAGGGVTAGKKKKIKKVKKRKKAVPVGATAATGGNATLAMLNVKKKLDKPMPLGR